jgi:hypothetical protein
MPPGLPKELHKPTYDTSKQYFLKAFEQLLAFFTFYERSTDFVISKKKFFIDFLDELGLFIEENPICKKKQFPSLAVCRLPRKVWLPTSTLSVQLRDFSFWISD